MTAEIEIHDDTLTFESIAKIPAGNALSLSLEPNRKLQVQVEVCRPLENGNYLVMARSPEPITALPSVDVAGSRSDVRVPERARVMSPLLANYSGLSVDFSLSGLQLELTGAVVVGELLPLQLALPGCKEDLSCQAEVVWCQQIGETGSYRAGCRFVDTEPQLYDALQSWLQSRLGRSLGFRSRRPAPAPQPVAPLVSSSAASAEIAEHHVELPQPIPLPIPIKPVMAHREEASLQATLRGYLVEQDRLSIQLQFLDQRLSIIEVAGLRSLSDSRGRAGEHVAYVATETNLERNVLRFFNPALESLLEVETHLSSVFVGAQGLAEKLA